MIPPRVDELQRIARLRQLIALEVARIVEDLQVRREFLVQMWSLHRDRGPFLDSVFSRWRTIGFDDLTSLSVDEVVAVEAFYRELDEFRLYISFTQDMPTMLSSRYDWICERLEAYGDLAVEALGGAPKRPMIEFADEDPDQSLLKFDIGPEETETAPG